jgi:hypothetical protein
VRTKAAAADRVAPGALARLRHLSLEIGTGCNLAADHPECPILQPGRWPDTSLGPLTIDDVLQTIDAAVALGFRGYVTFHYYNEPLLSPYLIRDIIDRSSYGRFMLWSNGLLLSREVEDNDILELFEWVMLSDYDPDHNAEWFEALARAYPASRIEPFTATFDSRLHAYEGPADEHVTCWRHRLELPVDHYGNVHLCCEDWRGSVRLGNVKSASLAAIVMGAPFAGVSAALCAGTLEAPAVCRTCTERISHEVFDDLCRGLLE